MPTVQWLLATGAQIPDFPVLLDGWIARDMRGLGPSQTRLVYQEFRGYYFAHNADPGREGRILEYLGE